MKQKTPKFKKNKKTLSTSLYLHIPFCDSKCGYCAFNSKTNKNHLKNIYMEKLAEYLQHKIRILKETYEAIKLTSVYIGGGTPNVVEARFYESVFKILEPFLKNIEISIEVNPNSLNLEWLRIMRDFGVNRLSIGAQSFNEHKLRFLEREHKPHSTFEAIENALKADFKNLSVDLIYGTPLCTESLLKSELKTACELPLSHISAYHLSIDSNSRFYKTKKFINESDGEFAGFLSIGHFVAAHLNYAQYEVSNYGLASKHNLNYWQGNNYLGIGAGAVGCIENVRTNMPSSVESFLSGFVEKKEFLSPKDLELEHLFLGFRSLVGALVDRIPNKEALAILLKENKVHLKNNRVFANDYFLGDEIALFLMR